MDSRLRPAGFEESESTDRVRWCMHSESRQGEDRGSVKGCETCRWKRWHVEDGRKDAISSLPPPDMPF